MSCICALKIVFIGLDRQKLIIHRNVERKCVFLLLSITFRSNISVLGQILLDNKRKSTITGVNEKKFGFIIIYNFDI